MLSCKWKWTISKVNAKNSSTSCGAEPKAASECWSDPRRLTLLDPRQFLSASARLAVVHPLSYMAAEMAAAPIFHQAPLHFLNERNVPPGIRGLLREENLPEFVIIN